MPQHQLIIRSLSALLAVALMLLIYHASSKPLTVSFDSFPLQDKLVHAIAYGVLASLFLLSMKLTPTGFSARQQLLAIVLATLYGISDEWHQSFVPERTADVTDIIADAVGAVIAVYLGGIISRRLFKPINWGQTNPP